MKAKLVKLAKKKPRQIYLFKRGNMDGVTEDMENLYRNSFQGSDDTISVELMWDTFKENMVDSINKHIPRKQHLKDGTYHTLPRRSRVGLDQRRSFTTRQRNRMMRAHGTNSRN